jgi:hypothetical protein
MPELTNLETKVAGVIQQRHLEEARRGSLQLAADEDPNEPAE